MLPHTHTHTCQLDTCPLAWAWRGRPKVAFAVAVVILVITTKIIIVVVAAAAGVVIVVSANIVIRVACYAKRKPEQATARRVAPRRVANNKMRQHLAAFFALTSFVFGVSDTFTFASPSCPPCPSYLPYPCACVLAPLFNPD